jgi:hypothetical protein
MLTINVTGWNQILRKPMQIKRGVRIGLDRVAKQGVNFKRANIIQPTYLTPITKGANGQPLWRRYAYWKGSQIVEKTGEFSRTIRTKELAGVRRSPHIYEPFLVKRPTSKRDGINRSNPAAARTVPQIERIAPRIIDVAIAQEIQK